MSNPIGQIPKRPLPPSAGVGTMKPTPNSSSNSIPNPSASGKSSRPAPPPPNSSNNADGNRRRSRSFDHSALQHQNGSSQHQNAPVRPSRPAPPTPTSSTPNNQNNASAVFSNAQMKSKSVLDLPPNRPMPSNPTFRPPLPQLNPQTSQPPQNQHQQPHQSATQPQRPSSLNENDEDDSIEVSEERQLRNHSLSASHAQKPVATSRSNVINEIFQTEKDYVADLEIAINKLLKPMRARSIIPEMDLARIFSNIEIIVDLNRDLLKRMEQRKKESPNDPNIGDLFLAHDNFFQSGYSAYCSDQSNALNHVNTMKKKSKTFSSFLEEVRQDPELRSLTIVDFISKPMQRICKYPLLLKELQKGTPQTHADYENVSKAMAEMTQVVQTINLNAREAENLRKLSEIENTLHNADHIQLMSGSRRFIMGGNLKKKGQARQFWLFSDFLMWAKPNKIGKTFEYKGLMSVLGMKVIDIPESEVSFLIESERRKFTLSTNKASSKLIWVQHLKNTAEEASKTLNQQKTTNNVAFALMQTIENQVKTVEVMDDIVGSEKIPLNATRQFLKEGPMDVLKSEKEVVALQCLLFDDSLVFVEKQSKKRKYIFKAFVPIDKALIVALDDTPTHSNLFEIVNYWSKTKLTVAVSSSELKNEWIELLDKRIESFLEKEKEHINIPLTSLSSSQPAPPQPQDKQQQQQYRSFVKESRKSYIAVAAKNVPTTPSKEPETSVEEPNRKQMFSELQKVLVPEMLLPPPQQPQSANQQTVNGGTNPLATSVKGRSLIDSMKKGNTSNGMNSQMPSQNGGSVILSQTNTNDSSASSNATTSTTKKQDKIGSFFSLRGKKTNNEDQQAILETLSLELVSRMSEVQNLISQNKLSIENNDEDTREILRKSISYLTKLKEKLSSEK